MSDKCILLCHQLCDQLDAIVTPRFVIILLVILLQTNKIFYIIHYSFLEMSDKFVTTWRLYVATFMLSIRTPLSRKMTPIMLTNLMQVY